MWSKQSTALQKDSPLSVKIIQQFLFCTFFFSFTTFSFCFIPISLDFHLDIVSLSGVQFTFTKFLFFFWWNRNKDPSGRFSPIYYYIHSRVPKCLLTIVISVLEWPIDFYIKVLVQIKTETKSFGGMVLVHLLHLRFLMFQTNISFWLFHSSAIELTFTSKFLFWWNRNKELWWKGSRPM